MSFDEGKLRAYLDQSLPADEFEAVKAYLDTSPEAQKTLARLREAQAQVAHHLTSLTAPATAHSPAPEALNRFQANLAKQSYLSINNPFNHIKERTTTMFKNPTLKRFQPAITALSFILAIALLFSFAPVRAMAGQFLQIFRVQEVRLIPVDLNHIENLENNAELKGLLDNFSPGAEVVSGGGEPQKVASLAEASKHVDFSPFELGALPDNVGQPKGVLVHEKSVYRFELKKDLLEAIFNAAEIEVDLPDSLNETPIVATKPATIIQQWGQRRHPNLTFVQLRSPEIEYPDDLDLNQLGVAGLQLLGMSQAEAIALGQTIDWANTLILPIPMDADITVTEVSVNGAKGFTFTHPDKRGRLNSALMWQTDGMTYLLAGDYSAEQILEIARSVQ